MDRSRASGRKKEISFRSKRRKTVHEHVSKGDIRRLARRGGVGRLSALIYNEMRSILKSYLDNLIKDSIVYCEYFKRKTVEVSDVLRALKSRGERLYGFDDPPFPISIRTSIVLNDTPEGSVPSTLELSETPETRSNAKNLKSTRENIPTTSRRFSKYLYDSDATVSENELPVRCNRVSCLISENDQITKALSLDNDSDFSDSLISPEINKKYAAKVNKEHFNSSKSTSKKTKECGKHGPLEMTTDEIAASPDDSESTEENDLFMTKIKNRKSSSTPKTSFSKRTFKDTETNISAQNIVRGKTNSDKNKEKSEMPLNVRRRRLFRHSRNTGLDYSDKIPDNTDKPSTSTVNPNDSDDFQDNFDFLAKKKKNNSVWKKK